jgi:glycosyltransferase involved in cell wall biosynthesis
MNLALFFTRNVSLKLWFDSGLFDREKQLYEEHLRRGHLEKVYWLTYGTDDTAIANELKASGRLHSDIVVLPMPHFFLCKRGCFLYSFLMPLFHRRWLKSADIFKTNQMDGSWTAILAKWLYRKPLIVRTGFTLSLLRETQDFPQYWLRLIKIVERLAYKNASVATVTTQTQAQYILEKYHLLSEKTVQVIPNYVDTQLFTPRESVEKYTDRLVFVGRLNERKNPFNLIDAVARTGLTLDIYGQGSLRQALEQKAAQMDVQVNFMGVVPNNELPGILNRYRYYILPSFCEGMPKTLLEAMACGLVCIGTDVEGINQIIEDGVNGYLAKGTHTDALVEVIKRAARLPYDSISAEGVRRVRNSFSLETVAEREKEIIVNLKR